MAESRRKFDQDFKEGAVRLVRETGKPIAQVARDLGINEGTPGQLGIPIGGAARIQRAVPGELGQRPPILRSNPASRPRTYAIACRRGSTARTGAPPGHPAHPTQPPTHRHRRPPAKAAVPTTSNHKMTVAVLIFPPSALPDDTARQRESRSHLSRLHDAGPCNTGLHAAVSILQISVTEPRSMR